MFVHTEFRPPWADVFILPWLLLGLAYLVGSVLYRRYAADASRRFHRKTEGAGGLDLRRRHRGTRILGWALLAATRLVLGDPAHESLACEAASPQEARSLADVLYERGEYQRAGECYQAAGDASHAQLAFLKAVGPNSEATARAFRQQQDAAKSLLSKVQQAFRSDH
jgi:hypothetical protein